MNHDAELKLQAWLDGELSGREAAEVKEWLAHDREAQLLLAELQNTGAALAGHEQGVKLPESGDFFWSKIRRDIERQEQAASAVKPSVGRPWLLRLLLPTGALAAIVFMAVWLASPSTQAATEGAQMVLASDDMGAYTFRDQEEGLTMIWLYDRQDDSQFTPGAAVDNVHP